MKGHFIAHVLPCAVLLDLLVVGVPILFEERGVTVTVTADRYVDMLRNFLEPKLRELEHLDV